MGEKLSPSSGAGTVGGLRQLAVAGRAVPRDTESSAWPYRAPPILDVLAQPKGVKPSYRA